MIVAYKIVKNQKIFILGAIIAFFFLFFFSSNGKEAADICGSDNANYDENTDGGL